MRQSERALSGVVNRAAARTVTAVLFGAIATGCSHDVFPTATVGDPTVFTTLHMVAADRSYAHDAEALGDKTGAAVGVSTLGHLQRYFGSPNKDFDEHALRMDAFLDQTQRSQAFAFLLARSLQLEGQFNEDGLKDPKFAESATADVANAQPSVLAGGAVKPARPSDAEKQVATAQANLNALQADQVGVNAKVDEQDAETLRQSKINSDQTTIKAAAQDVVAKQKTLKASLEQQLAAETDPEKKKILQAQIAAADKLITDKNKEASEADALATAAKTRGAETKANADGFRDRSKVLTDQIGKAATALEEAKKKLPAPTAPSNDIAAAMARLASPNDSPFDRLDRVNDWYMSYMTLILSAYGGDSRAIDTDSLKRIFKTSYSEQIATAEGAMRQNLLVAVTAMGLLVRDPDNAAYVANALALAKATNTKFGLIDDTAWDAIADRLGRSLRVADAANNAKALAKPSFDALAEQVATINKSFARGLDTDGGPSGPAAAEKLQKLRDMLQDPKATSATLMSALESALGEVDSLGSKTQRYIDARDTVKLDADRPCDASTPPDPKKYRIVTLLVPVSIRAGSRPNTLVGSRLELTKVTKYNAQAKKDVEAKAVAGDIRVLSVYPQRSYDLEDQQLTQSFRDTLRILVEIRTGKVGGKADFSMDKKQEEASRFLSRVAKIGAWQDAPNFSFGWTFAPSNIHVVPRPVGKQFLDFIGGQPGRAYEARSLLETGSRRCSATLLVKADVKSFDLAVSSYRLDVDEGKISCTENWVGTESDIEYTTADGGISDRPNKNRVLHVDLPKYDEMESLALTLPQP